ncbi:hypothetical protein SO802_020506 [Lithocarpus litseifolius]|uniref:BED-type domain-containing protein n=1 Tax=Lithocarpus litseifolius TaxID=425828 RepID=A0AAW2CHF6_9ROSI
MQCPETSAPSPSKIQNEVNSALPASSKRRRLVSEVWNDFKRVEVDGEHRAICNHCLKDFSGSSKSGTTHLKNHLSRCSAIQSGESSKRRRLVSKVWNDFERVEDNGERRALCKHCRKHFSGSSKSGTTHLKNHLSRCSAIKSPTLWRMAIPKSTSTSNSAFSIETTTVNPILNGCDPDILEALVCRKEWLKNPIRMDNERSPELTHTSFVSAGPSLSLETQEKHAPSGANMELILTNHRVTPNRDNEHAPEITRNSFVFPWASLSFEPQQKHAPSSANTELMVANPSSTSYPEPGPTDHSSFVSAGTFSSLELHKADAHNLVISAFKHWEEVVSFDDEASPVGSSSLLTNVYTASLPRTESSNVSKFLASHKIVLQSDLQSAVDNFISARAAIGKAQTRWTKLFSVLIWFSIRVALKKQVLGTDKPAKMWEVSVERAQTGVLEKRMLLYSPPNSPDIMSSFYSAGGSSGLDDYYLPSIDSMGLKSEGALSSLESMKNSFDDNDLNLFYTDLLTQDFNSESQLDL